MKTTFSILELECQSCAIMIESISEDFPGITKAEVHGREKQLVVEHVQPIVVKELVEALAKAGYMVKASG